MAFLWIVLIGFVAGIIARLLSSGPNKPTGFLLTTALGIAGACAPRRSFGMTTPLPNAQQEIGQVACASQLNEHAAARRATSLVGRALSPQEV